MVHIIGLSGNKGSGKNTAAIFMASSFIDQMGLTCNLHLTGTMAFADGLRQLLSHLTNVDLINTHDKTNKCPRPSMSPSCIAWIESICDDLHVQLDINQLKLYQKLQNAIQHFMHNYNPNWTIGKALQFLGTECIRDKVHPDFWIYYLKTRINKVKNITGLIIITDVRFPNEKKMIERMNGQVWRIERKNNLSVNSTDGRDSNHLSENALSNEAFIRVIENDGPLDEFGAKIEYHLSDWIVNHYKP